MIPMTTTKYLCGRCRTPHPTPEAATACEAIPVPEPPARVGQDVTYYAEDNLLGVRWSYCDETGPVLAGYVVGVQHRETREPVHVWFLICGGRYGPRGVMVNGDGRLFASADWYGVGPFTDRPNDLLGAP